jgi:hypothetical protein
MTWVTAAMGTCLVVEAVHLSRLHTRIDELESRPVVQPVQVTDLHAQLDQIGETVQTSLTALRRVARESEHTQELAVRLSELECELESAAGSINSQRMRIDGFESVQQEISTGLVEGRLAELQRDIDEQYQGVGLMAQRAIGLAETTQLTLGELERSMSRDVNDMWRDLLGPTVQLMGSETVGSGVLLESERVGETDEYVTHLITAWHVIRDIQTTPGDTKQLVPVTIYLQEGRLRPESAELLCYDATLDIALLRLTTRNPVPCGARLAPREHLQDVKVFERIYAVGCPLGNDPIPTFGEIADTRHHVDGQAYWMISAPTYIGNSGGGVFDAQTRELLGIFTKIYTHGTLRPTVVPHMGLATPLPKIYDWLESVGYANLEPRSNDAKPRTAASSR